MSTTVHTDGEPETDDEHSTDSDGTPLPKRFLVAASGPATQLTEPTAGMRQRTDIEISINHSVETLEEFVVFWDLRDRTRWKAGAIDMVLGRHEPNGVSYHIDEDQLEEWAVTADGCVGAFTGLVEAMADHDVTAASTVPNGIGQRMKNLRGGGIDPDDCIEQFADELRRSDLWGPGAHLAYLDVQNAHNESLGTDVERLANEFQETGR